MVWFVNNWQLLLPVCGGLFEVVGVFFMANRYLGIEAHQLLMALFSALYRGKRSHQAEAIAEIREDKLLMTFQGLSFIGFGAVLQMTPGIYQIFFKQ